LPSQLIEGSEEAVSTNELKQKAERSKLLEQALSIYSPSGEEKELAQLLKSDLENHRLKPRIDRAGNVICEIGSGKISLLLCGHMDTVQGRLPVKREGNLLYGRGACDAKGALLSMLFAFEDLSEELLKDDTKEKSGRLVLAAVTDEEMESRGLEELIKNGPRAQFAIFGEPCGADKVTIGYRGHVTVYVETKTKEGHGSAPWLSRNAAEVSFSIYERAKELWPCKNPESTDCVSVALTTIRSGESHNVIPGNASMTMDIRIPFGMNTSEIISKISSLISSFDSEKVNISFRFGEPTEPYRAKLNSVLVRAINRSLLKSGLTKPSFVVKSGTGDMNTFALSFGADAITYGPGDTKLSHSEDECVDIQEVFTCSNILKSTALELFELAGKNQ
jgi:LysW-gamma-L-lysine carboxypeptidase